MAKRVLIFDDDTDILEISKFVLEKRGFEVFTEQSCTNVIEDLKKYKPDVVIMDNWIPEIGGVEATRTIKSDPEFGKTPVILFTASKDIQSLTEEAGADAFIAKPFDLEEMEETVENVLKNQNVI
jgi:two-component system cell cycle response regulator DivK